MEEERRERDRQWARERYTDEREEQAPREEPVPEYRPPVSETAAMEEDPLVAPSERELLSFILRDGATPLRFETDSDFYAGDEPPTVAEFIDAALDGTPLVNSVYRQVWDAYFALYDEGLSQEQIVKRLGALGVKLDRKANKSIFGGKSGVVSTKDSKIPVVVIPTNEELMIARETQEVLS